MDFLETSAKDGKNINEAFKIISVEAFNSLSSKQNIISGISFNKRSLHLKTEKKNCC